MRFSSSDWDAQRRSAVALAVTLTAHTTVVPQRYERQLLLRYKQGELLLDEAEALLATSTYHVLYHSQVEVPLSEQELQAWLEQFRRYNAAHHITGLLLYSHERFIQVLEGPKEEVCGLYARIQADGRHHHIVTLCAEPGPGRLFSDWRMDFGYLTPDVERAMAAVEAKQPLPEPGVDDVRLQALFEMIGSEVNLRRGW